jgi:hypothetical protein
MIERQSSGDFSRENEKVSVRHYRFFFMISQQKLEKANFREKKFLKVGKQSEHTL